MVHQTNRYAVAGAKRSNHRPTTRKDTTSGLNPKPEISPADTPITAAGRCISACVAK